MGELILLLAIVLLLITLGAAILYYRQISKVRDKYGEAKDVMGDIIISFNKQLQRQENDINAVAHKTDMLSAKIGKVVGKVSKRDKQLAHLVAKVRDASEIERIRAPIKALDQKITNAIATQDALQQKINELEKARREVTMVPKSKIEMAIPIRKDEALAPLTDNQLEILKILAAEGEKTAPQLKDRIQITREHTARLMKKLYDNGYVERDTRKIPYIYRIKDEMREILKKARAM